MAPMLRDSRDLGNAASTSPAKAIRQINFSNVVRVDGEGHESLTHVEAFTTRPHLLRTYYIVVLKSARAVKIAWWLSSYENATVY